MRTLGIFCKKLGRWMDVVGGIALCSMMMLTVVDIVLRMFGNPIVGTYELVAVLSAITIGYAIPQTSLENGHIYVDFLVEKCPDAIKNGILIFVRILGIALFALLTWHLFLKGTFLYKAGDISQTLHIPYYPVAYALSFCAFIECFVLMMDIIRVFDRGEDEQ
jgi:TRAP-type C4-dicarboxylate transport system permease small subunit